MTKIDTVIFDLGAVLIDWNPFPVLLKAFDNDKTKTRWFLDNICHTDWNGQMDAGKSFEQAKKERSAEYPEYAKYVAIYLDQWEDMLLGPINGTLEIFTALKDSGKFRLYAITNWSAEKFPIARKRYSFLSWFDDIVVSGEHGIIKPDKKIFEYAVKRFELKTPETSVFIDDRMENIEVAEEFRIKGIHYKNPQQLNRDLKKLGINLNTNHK